MVKLHIVGIPSAGKTTLGRDLAALLDIAFHPLDEVAFVDERWTLRPVAARDAMIRAIVNEPDFVTEGGFLDWTEDLFAVADRIIWLDPPLRTLMWRHVRRHGRQPTSLPSLLWFQIRMYLAPAGAGPFASDPNQTRAGIARCPAATEGQGRAPETSRDGGRGCRRGRHRAK